MLGWHALYCDWDPFLLGSTSTVRTDQQTCRLFHSLVAQPQIVWSLSCVRTVNGIKKTVGISTDHMSSKCIGTYPGCTEPVDIPSINLDYPIKRAMTSEGHVSCLTNRCRADSRLAPSQWETALQSNAISHCLGTNLESGRADSRLAPSQWETSWQSNAVSHWLGANLESSLRRTANHELGLPNSLAYFELIQVQIGAKGTWAKRHPHVTVRAHAGRGTEGSPMSTEWTKGHVTHPGGHYLHYCPAALSLR